jgi:Crp-like helix-turn-helix domain
MTVAVLRGCAIFEPLGSPEVEAVVAGAPVLELEAEVVLTPAEFEGVTLVVVEEGLAIVRAEQVGTTRGVVVCHAGPGRLVLPPRAGEVLKTLVPTRATVFTRDLCDRLFEVPGAAQVLFAALAETLRQKHRTIATLASVHHVDRVRDKLIQLASEHGRVSRDGVRLDLPLTHELLGEMVGSARETVTRALDELQGQGFVVRRGRSYRLNIDPNDLPAP